MKYRKLGNTGYDVSTIGFGTWQIGGGRWHQDSEAEAIELLQKANDLGVNIFDAAIVYGQERTPSGEMHSKSQELLGKAFVNRREKVIYCIKLGQFDEYTHRHDYNPDRVIRQFKQSLNNLKTDSIDICLVHAPSIEKIKDGKAITILKTLQALGLVKAVGYSFEAEPSHVVEAVKQDIDVIMLQYNLIDTQCKKAIQLAHDYGIGILVGGPYKRGYLTGRYTDKSELPMTDDYWKWNMDKNPFKVESILRKIKELLVKYSDAKFLRKKSLQFILKEQGCSSCVIGHRDIAEVIENIEHISGEQAEIKLG